MKGQRLKSFAKIIAGQSPSSDEVEPLNRGQPFIQGNAEFGLKTPTPVWQCDTAPKVAQPADVLLSVRAPVGAVNITTDIMGIGRGIAAVRADSADLERWLYWVLVSSEAQLQSRSTGSTFQAISASDIGDLRVQVPANPQGIADYLDHEIAEIDALISGLQQAQLLVDERRIAALGAEIGFPESFHVGVGAESGLVQTQHLASIALGKMLDSSALKPGDSEYRYLRAANVQPAGQLALKDLKSMRFTARERALLTIKAGDVVVVEGGVGGYGRAAYVPMDIDDVGFQNSIIRLRPHANVDGRYLAYALILLRARGYIETVASAASMPHYTVEKVAATPIPRKTTEQQRQSADRLDRLWSSTHAMWTDSEAAIALARERRAALISAAMTGQIDVIGHRRGPSEAERLEAELADAR